MGKDTEVNRTARLLNGIVVAIYIVGGMTALGPFVRGSAAGSARDTSPANARPAVMLASHR